MAFLIRVIFSISLYLFYGVFVLFLHFFFSFVRFSRVLHSLTNFSFYETNIVSVNFIYRRSTTRQNILKKYNSSTRFLIILQTT